MILKWFNSFDQWVIKDGFDEIRYKKTVDETEKTIERVVSCYVATDFEGQPSFELVDKIKLPEDDKKEHEDFTSMYILNNDGKTVERIN